MCAQHGGLQSKMTIVNRPLVSSIALWLAWVVAGMVGPAFASLAFSRGWLSEFVNAYLITTPIVAAIMAFPQYVVLRLLTRRSSLATALWIPATAAAWLAAGLATGALQVPIANGLFSVDAIRPLIPGSIPFLTVIIGVETLTIAAFLGVGQGLLLARVFMARWAPVLWFAANLLPMVVISIVGEIRAGGDSGTNQTELDLVLSAALFGGLNASVPGIALVALARRGRRADAPAPSTAPEPAAR